MPFRAAGLAAILSLAAVLGIAVPLLLFGSAAGRLTSSALQAQVQAPFKTGIATVAWASATNISGYSLVRDGTTVATAGPEAVSTRFSVSAGVHTLAVVANYLTTTTTGGGGGTTHVCAGRSFDVDYVSGSDANAGTSTGAPWKRAPGMVGFAGTYSHQPHDCFYFKGGVSWPNAVFPLTLTGSGDASAQDYYGPDYSWYAGSAWSRPVFDAGGAPIAGTRNEFVEASYTSYVTIDDVEMTGFNWTTSPAYQACQYIRAYDATDDMFDHLYLHGWAHSGAATDDCTLLTGMTGTPFDSGTVIQNSVFDGADSTNGGDSMIAAQYMPGFVNNVCNDLPNCWLGRSGGGDIQVSGNLITNCNLSFSAPAVHENALESTGGDGTTYHVLGNVIHDTVSGCESMFLGNTGETDYVANNVIYNLGGNMPEFDPGGNGIYLWNNTTVKDGSYGCFRLGAHSSLGTEPVQVRNNHCVTDHGSAYAAVGGAITADHNTVQTLAATNADGYSGSSVPPYYPTSGSGATVNTGADLSASCTGNNSGLCSSTPCAVTYNTTNHTAVVPGCIVVTRPQGGTWDVGAYER